MSRRVSLSAGLLAVALFDSVLPAQETIYPEGAEGGRQLAAKLRANQPAEDSKWDGTLQIHGRDHKTVNVPVVCQTMTTSSNWTVTYVTAETNGLGAEKLVVIHAGDAPNQYLYARAAAGAMPGKLKPLTAADADVPLGGSDFWLSDLGFEFYHWPEQRVRKDLGSVHRSRGVHVLESVNPHPAPGGYGRVVTYIDKESEAPIEATAYAADGRTKLKEFSLGAVTKINGHYELKDMEISNRKTGSRTTLLFDLKTK
jgi:hypothetical protein